MGAWKLIGVIAAPNALPVIAGGLIIHSLNFTALMGRMAARLCGTIMSPEKTAAVGKGMSFTMGQKKTRPANSFPTVKVAAYSALMGAVYVMRLMTMLG